MDAAAFRHECSTSNTIPRCVDVRQAGKDRSKRRRRHTQPCSCLFPEPRV